MVVFTFMFSFALFLQQVLKESSFSSFRQQQQHPNKPTVQLSATALSMPLFCRTSRQEKGSVPSTRRNNAKQRVQALCIPTTAQGNKCLYTASKDKNQCFSWHSSASVPWNNLDAGWAQECLCIWHLHTRENSSSATNYICMPSSKYSLGILDALKTLLLKVFKALMPEEMSSLHCTQIRY